ncbi:PP2C family protein-serine/threonine phosphatase [Blastococcus sp. SYSU D00820]
MPQVQLSWGSATHIGQREENEDRLLAVPPLFAVADGMGGHAAGAEAAQRTVDSLAKTIGRPVLTVPLLQETVRAAHASIQALGNEQPAASGAGTTLAGVALVEEDGDLCWAVFHIGDSRVYGWTPSTWGQLTVDHSLVQVLIEAGHVRPENAATHPQRNIVTRALGAGGGGDADVTLLAVVPGQRFLVCSDGLSNEVSDERLAELMGSDQPAGDIAQQLVTEAADNGGRDNIAAVVVHVDGVLGDGASGAGATAAPEGEPEEQPATGEYQQVEAGIPPR